MNTTQAFAYDAKGNKQTASDERIIAFLNRLPVGTPVFWERTEWNTRTQTVDTVIECTGYVVAGPFGDNQFNTK